MEQKFLSDSEIKALTILDSYGMKNISARDFAKEMWPESECWNRVKNTGNGATSGKGMWLSAGSYLSKLRKKGLVMTSIVGSTTIFHRSHLGDKMIKKHQNEEA